MKRVKDEVTAFSASCFLSSYIWVYDRFFGWVFSAFFCMVFVTALPGLAQELLLQNALFDFYFCAALCHKRGAELSTCSTAS